MRVEDIETFNFDKAGTDLGNAYDEGYKQGRRHAAKEIINEIKAFIYNDDNLMERINIIAKQYEVDVEE